MACPGAGPGRFWGYWHLRRAVAAQEIDQDTYTTTSRTLRRYAAAQHVTRRETVRRADTRTGTVRTRTVRRRLRRFRRRSGWLSVNDGPALASALARAVTRTAPAATPAETRARLTAATGTTHRPGRDRLVPSRT